MSTIYKRPTKTMSATTRTNHGTEIPVAKKINYTLIHGYCAKCAAQTTFERTSISSDYEDYRYVCRTCQHSLIVEGPDY